MQPQSYGDPTHKNTRSNRDHPFPMPNMLQPQLSSITKTKDYA